MDWLGWAMWQRCPRACAWDEQCYLPMWPIYLGGRGPRGPPPGGPGDARPEHNVEEDELKPRCAKMDLFM